MQAAWTMHIIPLRNIFPLRIEYLNSMAFAVRNIYIAIFIGMNAVDDVELTWIRAGLTPGEEELAMGCVLVNPGVTIPIRHVYVARLWIQCYFGRAVEGKSTLELSWLILGSQGHEYLAIQGEFLHGMVTIIRAVQGVIRGYGDPVRPIE